MPTKVDIKESRAASFYRAVYPLYPVIEKLDETWKQGIKMFSEEVIYSGTSIAGREQTIPGSTISKNYNGKGIEAISDTLQRLASTSRGISGSFSGLGHIKTTGSFPAFLFGDIVYIERLQDPRYELIIPISIRLEREGGEIILSNEKLNNIYGVGNTIDEAMADFEDALLNYYDFLLDEQENLSAFFKEQLEYLKERILIK